VARALNPDSIRLVPLGGLGEIGMNCLAIEQEDGILVVDCGTGFPHDDLGVDVIHPDFSWLLERAARVSGVFITHGHEDHIGGLPYLLSELDVPVFGPRHSLGLVRERLADHEFSAQDVDLREANPGLVYQVGPFKVEPVRVSHSICEASALCITTAAGTVLHTGDFNMDPDPPDGEPIAIDRLQSIGDAGVELLLSDSTNIDTPERRGSERGVGAALEPLVRAAEERVIIALFASNVQRLILLGKIAESSGRKLCLLGRSLLTQVDVATRIGRLRWPSDLCVSPERAAQLPRKELLVLAGGSQAERNSALRRLAAGSHHLLQLEAGDSVLLSSRIIPGNERPVFEMMSDLLRRGVRLHTVNTDPGIHTSGHAGRSEQRRMLELTRPRAFMPLHGTLHHLLRHAELAREVGVRDTLVVENGTSVIFDGNGLQRDEEVPHGKVAIAMGGEPIDADTLWRRAELGRAGVVTLSVVLDREGRVLGTPRVSALGVPQVDKDPGVLRNIAREALKTMERVRRYHGVEWEDELRRAVRRQVLDVCGSRPNIEVHILDLES
jgi:ribonuclease J